MTIFYILIPLALFIAAGFLGLFFWANRDGQFEDLETPAHRLLFEED